jgi:hypothetical protein
LKLSNGQFLTDKSIVLQIYGFAKLSVFGGIAVDALVFEFMGLAILALCIVVLAVPSRRPPARQLSDY